jgi:hypothetical protein
MMQADMTWYCHHGQPTLTRTIAGIATAIAAAASVQSSARHQPARVQMPPRPGSP